MEKAVTATEAGRTFSRLLRDVRNGDSYVVTNHGRPVARIGPIDDHDKAVARKALLARLRAQSVVKVPGRPTASPVRDG